MENISFEKRDNVAVLKISRPKFLNALNSNTLLELDSIIEDVKRDKDIYVLVITGEGNKAFVAGADIKEMSNMFVFEAREFSILGNSVFRKIEELEIPTIAAVNGYALGGGCELSLCCDIRIASENAKFGQPEVTLGITPGFGGTQRLARIIGTSRAKELIYTGRMIDAKEAEKIGLVNKVVPQENLMDEVMDLANSISKNAPVAVRMCKVAINRGIDVDIKTGIQYEAEIFSHCFSTEDQRDAMAAFLDKRKVDKFKNR
ncbi:MAG: enoyl-CoA hydratase/isomerase family protein [Caloramator sp.]|jgi:enoyl-CoA hydratase|uniref:short-chain-enoyl-CoA hydratase n=1 Tax=Caloramator sp. TaxID=1871330 RepID=UPI001D9B65D9|nr:short-chain-enoyl-CoA hydratase [Caloramator sp.]MBZ4663380.1 enoyl-CoA hydratase/isomerase family protein [Caloramator sp.]